MQRFRERRSLGYIYVFLIFFIVALCITSRDLIAQYSWGFFQKPELSLILNVKDSALAMEVGMYAINADLPNFILGERAFLEAATINNLEYDVHYQLANIYYQKNNHQLATIELLKELQNHPENIKSNKLLGVIYFENNEDEGLLRAEKNLKIFTSAVSGDWEVMEQLTWVQIRLGKFDESFEILNTILSATSTDPTALEVWREERLGVIYRILRDKDKELALKIGTAYFSSTDSSGFPYDPQRAEALLKYALYLDLDFEEARYQLGRTQFIRGNAKDAIDTFTQVIDSNDGLENLYYFNAYYMRGLAYGHRKQFDEGIVDFAYIIENRGFSTNQTNVWALYADIGWLLFQKGDYEETLRYSDEGLIDFPGNPWLLSNKGAALLNLNRKEEAEIVLQEALTESKKITVDEWGRSYPGNNPISYESGLYNMIAAIEKNFELSKK